MDPLETSDPALVCLDSDVVIAGLFSTEGASHALLMLAEMGLLAPDSDFAGRRGTANVRARVLTPL